MTGARSTTRPRPQNAAMLDEIAAFARVAEAGSFTAAATQLGVPKSTLSRAVTRLEDAMKVRLFQRSPRAVALTDAGRRFFADVSPHLCALADAARALDDYQGQPQGTLRISVPPDSGETFLGEMLVELNARYPLLEVEVDVSARRVDLLREGFDLALRTTLAQRDASLVARKLLESSVRLYAAPSYLARRGQPRTFDDLTAHDRIGFRPSVPRWQWPADDAQALSEVLSTGRLVTGSFELIRSALRAGGGIGPLPHPMAASDLAGGRLVQVMPDWSLRAGTLYVVYPSARHVPRNVAVFRDFALAWAKRLA